MGYSRIHKRTFGIFKRHFVDKNFFGEIKFYAFPKSKNLPRKCSKLSENEIIYLINILLKAKTELKSIDNQILYMELLLLRLSKIKDLIPIKYIIDKFIHPSKNIIYLKLKKKSP